MDIKAVRELTRLMRDHDLIEVEVESPDLKVRLCKAGGAVAVPAVAPAPVPAPAAPGAPATAPSPAVAPVDEFADCQQIISPVPGTVYLRPNPDSKTYVQVGDEVADGQVVCLIEAMKVFNEIKAEGVAGRVRKVCVEDAQAVEYGTVLFLVE